MSDDPKLPRLAMLAFAGAAALAAILVARGEGRILGIVVPAAASYALVALGLGLGLLAARRRQGALALAGVGLLALGVAPSGLLAPGILDYALGLAFGALALGAGELVHMAQRHGRGARAAIAPAASADPAASPQQSTPALHEGRVTAEALRTLAERLGLALAAAAGAVALAFLLQRVGPASWRAGVETTAPLGVALAGLVLLGAVSLFILVRGATLRRPTSPDTTESAPDVAE